MAVRIVPLYISTYVRFQLIELTPNCLVVGGLAAGNRTLFF